MIVSAAKTTLVESNVQLLFLKMLKDTVIKQETIELVKYITQQDDIKKLTSDYFSKVFETENMKREVVKMLTEGTYHGLIQE